jgi:uroporphyrinogen decarboxylase
MRFPGKLMSEAMVKSRKKNPASAAIPVAALLGGLTFRERFLKACRCERVDRPPVWLMRQAGRALPEYRKLKEKYTFLQLAQTPELAAEVTLQPIRRFGFDAAIIFSDILVVPEAMGVPYRFRETGGVEVDFAIKSAADIENLSVDAVVEKLTYVTDAIRLVRSELGEQTALLGFAGSPWTLANFMLDGGSAKEHTGGLKLFRENRSAFESLCGKLTDAVTMFLRAQIAAGVDAIQIFDSLGGLLPEPDFQAASGVWMREIVAALGPQAPVIVFSKGTRDWPSLLKIGADALGIDHGVSLAEIRRKFPIRPAIQGNLDPECVVTDKPEQISARVVALLEQMRGRNGYIFNLGHGLLPNARLENVQAIVDTIREAA